MKLKMRLPEIRAQRGRLTLTQISKDTGIALSTLSRLDSGKSKRVDYEIVAKLCEYLQITPGDLFVLVPDEDEGRWSRMVQASLARVWDHPDEDIYSFEDGEPL